MTASKNHGNLLCACSQPACVPHAVLPDVDNQTPDNSRWYCPTRLPKQRARLGGFGPRMQTAFSTQCTNLQSRTRRQHPAAHDRDELVKDESFHCQRELGTIVPRLCDSVVPVDTGILPKQGYDEPSALSGRDFGNQCFQQDRAPALRALSCHGSVHPWDGPSQAGNTVPKSPVPREQQLALVLSARQASDLD